MILCKPTVRFRAFTPANLRILNTLLLLAAARPDLLPEEGLVITSANDSGHMKGSRHYTNEALDVRSKSFGTLSAKVKFRGELQGLLGSGFTVLLEGPGTDNEHFHIQVKKGTTFNA